MYENVQLRPLLSKQEEIKLCKIIKKGKPEHKVEEAKNILIESNVRLVLKIAERFSNGKFGILSFEDLVMEGNIGLITAASKFDDKFGTRFSTYASIWIKQAIYRAITKTSRLIRIPDGRAQLYMKVWEHVSKKYTVKNKAPNISEISKKFKISKDEVIHCLDSDHSISSLDAPISTAEGDGEALQTFIKDDFAKDPLNEMELTNFRETIQDALSFFNYRDRKIIEHRFGLFDCDRLTLEEVGAKFDVTRERIRQLEMKAIRKIRAFYEEKSMIILDDDRQEA